ncbi:MAG TPA: peptidylprolyl isomerase [Bryobacteraceae bacterium]|nr:peptidylprolyl isomerase [Bryobacteraceae bacterium]
MFDLFRSRAKLVRILLGAMLGVMALSMLVYLIPGSGMTTAADSSDQVVAEIGKSDVTVAQVQQQLRNVLQNRQLPPDLAATYIPQIVDQAIAERAVSYEAEQLGVRISNRDLADEIRSLPFASLSPDQYQQYVEQQTGMSVQEFENNMRLQAYENTVLNMAEEGIIVTPAEAQAEYSQRNEKIKVDYIGFDPSKLTAEIKPTPAELSDYFAKNHSFYNIPETRSLQLIVADQAKIADTIQIPDSQVQAYYDAHKDQFRTPARVHARHILLSTTNKPKDQVPKIKAQAEDILKQIKAGGNFAELAKKYSQDPGSAQKGGDLGWVSRGQMVKNFEDTVFALKDNEISPVVTTEYGFHIIQVLERQPAHLQTLDEVKPQILATLRNQTVFDKMQNLTDQAHAALVKAPQNAQQIATQLGLSFVNVPSYAPGTALPDLGSDAQVGATIGAMKPGDVSQEIQSGNKLAVVVVTAVHPPHPAQLSEVEAQVRQDYVRVNGAALVKQKADKVAELLKQNGGDLKAAAKAVGAEVKSTDFFTRAGAAEGIGSASLLANEFQKPVGTIFGPLIAANQTIVGKLVARQGADMSQFAKERDSIVLQLKAKKYADQQSLLQDSVLTDLIRRGKVKKHQQVIDRLIAQYKS